MILIGTADGLYGWDEASGEITPAGAQGRRVDEVVVAPGDGLTIIREHVTTVLQKCKRNVKTPSDSHNSTTTRHPAHPSSSRLTPPGPYARIDMEVG